MDGKGKEPLLAAGAKPAAAAADDDGDGHLKRKGNEEQAAADRNLASQVRWEGARRRVICHKHTYGGGV